MTSLIQTLADSSPAASRRLFMGRGATLSAVAVAMLAGKDALAQGMGGDTSKDVGILNVALGLEHEAINAYLGVIPAFGNRDLAKVAWRLAADETLHYVLLNNALGRPLPVGALSFGA